jgi:hypothetical protein
MSTGSLFFSVVAVPYLVHFCHTLYCHRRDPYCVEHALEMLSFSLELTDGGDGFTSVPCNVSACAVMAF